MGKILLGLISLALSGCAAAQNVVFYQYHELEGIKSKSLDRLKWENAIRPEETISKSVILEMDYSSAHMIQIRGGEKKHIHEFHDATVFIQSGWGRMYLGKSSVNVKPGSVIFIPHGVLHYFVNGGPEPATAFAIFSPAFDGKDTVNKE